MHSLDLQQATRSVSPHIDADWPLWSDIAPLWETLGHAHPDTDTRFAEEISRLWSDLTARPLPNVEETRHEFLADLFSGVAEDPEQACHAYRHYLAGAERDPACYVQQVVLAFLKRLRPWYALWFDFVVHATTWARLNSYNDAVFLARDALVFYALAKGAFEDRGDDRLLVSHMSRGAGDYVSLGDLLPSAHQRSVAYLDSGCYGTVLCEIIRREHRPDDLPAAFFFFSRNPHVFGYLNYVVARKRFPIASPDARREYYRLIQAAVISLDTVEALPKPYLWTQRSAGGFRLSGLLSFVLAKAIYEDVFHYARARRTYGITTCDACMLDPLKGVTRRLEEEWSAGGSNDPIFWVPSVATSALAGNWLESWPYGTLFPQNQIFGIAMDGER